MKMIGCYRRADERPDECRAAIDVLSTEAGQAREVVGVQREFMDVIHLLPGSEQQAKRQQEDAEALRLEAG
ncbi:MAG: hypothetical protein U1F68_18980 [Gammaproteobacteria bacterium]